MSFGHVLSRLKIKLRAVTLRRCFSAAVCATAAVEPQSNRDSVIQGQNCLFTCPVLDVYKYHTFSLSEQVLLLLRTLNFKDRF